MVSHTWTEPAAMPPAVREGLLGPGLRRALGDLNLMFLQRAADPGMRGDPRFSVPSSLAEILLKWGPDVLSRASGCPFALFGLSLPPDAGVPRVADREAPIAPATDSTVVSEQVLAFTHPLLSVVRSVVFVAPLALSLAFGMPPGSETALSRLLPSEEAWLARWAGLVRPRWPHAPRFWETLLSAASRDCPQALQHAHSLGLCMLGPLPGPCPAGSGGTATRKPRR